MIYGPDLVSEAEEIVHCIQSNLKAARAQHESYANKRHLHVSPMQGVKRFGIKGKLAPRYIGPCPILAKLGNVAYRLELLPSLNVVYNMFHVSQLKKCLKPPADVAVDDVTPLDANLCYLEHPVKLLRQ
jgi:hypothetical protein